MSSTTKKPDFLGNFTFEQINERKYKVSWVFRRATGAVIDRQTDFYVPRFRVTIKDMNEARSRISQWIRSKYLGMGITKNVHMVCDNPSSDFLTLKQKVGATWAKKREEKAKLAQLQATPVQEVRDVKTGKPEGSERRFEVTKINGVWTIVAHEHELLTEQEAKTLFFAKIVNGD